jgi:hypothetical protein
MRILILLWLQSFCFGACDAGERIAKAGEISVFSKPSLESEIGRLPGDYPILVVKNDVHGDFVRLKRLNRWVRTSDLLQGQKAKEVFYMIGAYLAVEAKPRKEIPNSIESKAIYHPYAILNLYSTNNFVIQEPYDREKFSWDGPTLRTSKRKFRNFYGTYKWAGTKLIGKITEEDQPYALPLRTKSLKKVERDLTCEFNKSMDHRFWCYFKNDSMFKEWILTRSPFEIMGYDFSTKDLPDEGAQR